MLDKLSKEVIVSPYDLANVQIFFHEFEKSGCRDTGLQGIYLKLQYFHSPNRSETLNALGKLYLDQSKHYLSELCFTESIRLNPSQPDIYKMYEEYVDRLSPEIFKYDKGKEQEDTISVVMGTYNRSKYIRESLESVLKQTYGNFEILLINDGGTNDVEDLLRVIDSPKIKYIRFKENRGHAAVLNEGIRRSSGKYIAYLDDDDIYYPNHLESLVNALKGNKYKIVYSNTKMVSGTIEGGSYQVNQIKGVWNIDHDKNKLIRNNYISNLCVLHEKSIFSEIGLFFEDLRVVMDWEFWLRASLKYQLYHEDIHTGEYRFNESNVTAAQRLHIDFYTELIRNYYLFFMGKISCHKYLQHYRRHKEAKIIYHDIKMKYNDYFKAPALYEELVAIASTYNDKPFVATIAKDYFQSDTRDFMKHIKTNKSFNLLCQVTPLMPNKIISMIKNRAKWADT